MRSFLGKYILVVLAAIAALALFAISPRQARAELFNPPPSSGPVFVAVTAAAGYQDATGQVAFIAGNVQKNTEGFTFSGGGFIAPKTATYFVQISNVGASTTCSYGNIFLYNSTDSVQLTKSTSFNIGTSILTQNTSMERVSLIAGKTYQVRTAAGCVTVGGGYTTLSFTPTT